MTKWRVYKRKGAALRKASSRFNHEYDGSKWILHKSYKSEADASKAVELLVGRNTFDDGFKLRQFMLVAPGQDAPKTSIRR